MFMHTTVLIGYFVGVFFARLQFTTPKMNQWLRNKCTASIYICEEGHDYIISTHISSDFHMPSNGHVVTIKFSNPSDHAEKIFANSQHIRKISGKCK